MKLEIECTASEGDIIAVKEAVCMALERFGHGKVTRVITDDVKTLHEPLKHGK